MQESRVPPQEYVRMSAINRIASWKWWFKILLVAGLVAAALIMWHQFRPAAGSQGTSILPSFVGTAFAHGQGDSSQRTGSSASRDSATSKPAVPMTPPVTILILAVIAVVTLSCLGYTLFGSNEDRVKMASDTLKTCLGFWIGLATAHYGGTA